MSLELIVGPSNSGRAGRSWTACARRSIATRC